MSQRIRWIDELMNWWICRSQMPVDVDKSMPRRIVTKGNVGSSSNCLHAWLCPSSKSSRGRKISKWLGRIDYAIGLIISVPKLCRADRSDKAICAKETVPYCFSREYSDRRWSRSNQLCDHFYSSTVNRLIGEGWPRAAWTIRSKSSPSSRK